MEAHQDHPLKPLLCSSSDTLCGAETQGWRRRAEAFFEAHRTARWYDTARTLDEPGPYSAKAISAECAEKMSEAPSEQRYQQWRACVETRRPNQTALPLGNVKAPATGWLVISGRRGHYEFCDTTRAYNLAAGAAYTHDSCSALVLKPGGHVDFDATGKGRAERVSAGVMSVGNLREALWMMLLRSEAEKLQLRAEYYPLPDGLTPRLTVRSGQVDRVILGGFSTAQTVLTWAWTPDTGAAVVGALWWPDSSDTAERYAASLLAVAEHGFVKGCASGQVSSRPVLTRRNVHNLDDVPVDAIDEFELNFHEAVQRWSTLTACRPGGP